MPAPDAPAAAVKALALAVAFLTRVPMVPRQREVAEAELVRAATLFPIVGAAIGALVGAVATALDGPLGPLLAASTAVLLDLCMTGALHLDGLADSADGLAGRTPARRLEIMRDHAVGTYGAAAIFADLTVKVAALAALAPEGAVAPAVAAYALSRVAPLPLAAALPYARPGPGTARVLTTSLRARHAAFGLTIAVAVAVATLGVEALAPVAVLAAVVVAVRAFARRSLSGVTGDVMGAAVELVVALALVSAVAVR